MKMKFTLATALSLLANFQGFTVIAQSFVASELITTDTTTGATSDAINALELYDNGLYWTIPSLRGGIEFGHEGGLALMAQRDTPVSRPYYLEKSGVALALGFATRDDTFVYYTYGGGVSRKPVDGGQDDLGTSVVSGWNVNHPGSLMVYQGRVYYAYGNTTPFRDAYSTHVQFAIEYFQAPGDGALGTPVRVAMGTTFAGDPGEIKKLGVALRKESGVSSLVPFGIGLTANGYLLAFNVEAPPSILLEARVLASDVSDFVVRREQYTPAGGVQLPYEQDTLYVTVGKNVCAGSPRGTIERIDPLNGNVNTFWTAPDGVRLAAIGADQDYFFVSSFAVGSSGAFGCKPSETA